MGYLHPPPGDAPVIVMKDVGGDVREYSAMTTAYIRSGREVRLHECRSACTLALAVPNVCVYPSSVLRFHKAYNPITKATNEAVSSAMLSAYPPAVRERLGILTREYKSLSGSELIRLGVRDCNAPAQPRIMIARATPKPVTGDNPLSNAFGGLMAGLSGADIPAYSGYSAPVQVQRVKVQVAEAAPPAPTAATAKTDALPPQQPDLPPQGEAPPPATSLAAPVPPPRPADLAEPASQIARNDAATLPPDPPTPPFRPLAPAAPPSKTASHWGLAINGSAPVLAAQFAPFAYRVTRKG